MLKLEWEFPEKLEFLFQPSRYKIAHGGRGGSKSWGFARALLIEGWQRKRRILCAREVQKSIKDSVHRLLADQTQLMGLGKHYEVLQNEIRGANGTEFLFTGLSNQTAESIKSYEGIDICWVEEAHKVTRKSWDILIPTIRADGSEIWISMNPELDTDETFVRFIENPPLEAVVTEIGWQDNKWFPAVLKKEREEMLRQVEAGIRSQDDYDNIWEGKCRAAVEGAIYSKEILAAKLAGRLGNVPYDPLLKVHCIWDLGWNDKMAIIMAQRSSSEIRVVNYIEDSHRTFDSYVNELEALDYRWGQDFLPHDGKAKNAQTGMSPIELLTKLGRDVKEVPNIGVEEGIKASRQIFPRVYFDRDNSAQLFNTLGHYRRTINQTTQQPGAPLHDDSSNGADAFRYMAVVADKLTNERVHIEDPYAGFNRAGSHHRIDIREGTSGYRGGGRGWAG